MHSRSVLCMTRHYNFYYVCMYVLDGVCISTHEKGHFQGGDIGIFPHAAEHCSQWP